MKTFIEHNRSSQSESFNGAKPLLSIAFPIISKSIVFRISKAGFDCPKSCFVHLEKIDSVQHHCVCVVNICSLLLILDMSMPLPQEFFLLEILSYMLQHAHCSHIKNDIYSQYTLRLLD